MPRLESDLLDLLMAASRDGGLAGKQAHWRSETALTVVMAAHGYPGAYRKGTAIGGLDRIDDADTIVFHAGTTRRDGDILATGGRVLCVTGLGANVTRAAAKAYDAVARIDWPGGFNRSDIGWREIARERGKGPA